MVNEQQPVVPIEAVTEDDFAGELAQIAMQFARLMHLAARMGIRRPLSHHRELRSEIKRLIDDTGRLIDSPIVTQELVDILTARYHHAMPRLLDAIKIGVPSEFQNVQ